MAQIRVGEASAKHPFIISFLLHSVFEPLTDTFISRLLWLSNSTFFGLQRKFGTATLQAPSKVTTSQDSDIMFALFAALALATSVHAADELEKINIGLEWFLNPDHLPLIVAIEEGEVAAGDFRLCKT